MPARHRHLHSSEHRKLITITLALYGLKFAPFSPKVPTEALYLSPKIESFCWRVEQAHLREGGWALIHGDPGSGKSVVLRVIHWMITSCNECVDVISEREPTVGTLPG